MKKQGFTLAEILIAMGLVGVIAAMTVPTFVINCRQQANDSKFASTVADLENAFGNMVTSELVDIFGETKFYGDMSSQTQLGKYVKLNGTVTPVSYKSGAGCKTALTVSPLATHALKNGAYFIPVSTSKAYIDVNGKDKPNCLSKDLFEVEISEHGFLKKK